MALTFVEYERMDAEIKACKRYLKHYPEGDRREENESRLKQLQEKKCANRIDPAPGDLLVDAEYPFDGVAIVVEVADRRRNKCYKIYTTAANGRVIWLPRNYVQYQCKYLKSA